MWMVLVVSGNGPALSIIRRKDDFFSQGEIPVVRRSGLPGNYRSSVQLRGNHAVGGRVRAGWDWLQSLASEEEICVR